jgi:hypothetical protein
MQTTRKHPRTLEEAFGPYARGHLFEKTSSSNKKDEIVLAASIVALLSLLIIFAIWG